MAKVSTVDTVDGDTLLEMVLGMINDASDAQLAAVAAIVVGPTRQTGGDTFEVALNGPAFAPVPIETLFTAFQTFLNDSRRAAPNVREMAVARDTFKTAIGPLAALIDWTDRS